MILGRLPQGSAVALVPPVVVPAPVAEVVYPDTDGEPLAGGTAQYVALTSTVDKLKGHYRTRSDVTVIGNMLVCYEKAIPRRPGPRTCSWSSAWRTGRGRPG